MRSLSPTLLAAQKEASAVPFVRTVVQNTIRGVTHLQFTQSYAQGGPDDQHDAAADSNYLHRVRVRAGTPQYERNAGSGWSGLNAATDADVIAVAVTNDERVIVVYNRGAALYFRESTDQGATFGSETQILTTTAAPNAVAVAYKNTSGDLVVFWEDGGTVKRIRRTSGSFGSAASWTQSANSINGMDAIKAGDFLLALTGTDSADRPTVWTLVLGDGFSFSTDTWTQFFILNQAESDEQITFQAPFVDQVDTLRLTYVEKFSGSPNYSRTYWTMRQPAAFTPGGDWEWMDPVPLDNTTEYGYAIAAGVTTPTTVFYSRPGQVLEAELSSDTLDMSADLLEATISEDDGLRQRAELVFDNANGQYAGPPAPIALHHDVDLGLGYDDEFSRPPGQSIIGWEYRRDGGKSTFVLFTRGNAYWLTRSRPRTTITRTAALTQIARGAAARAGIEFLNVGSSFRAINYILSWTIHPHQTSLEALEALAELMPDIYLTYNVGSLVVFEPKASDPIDYSYGSDHAIYHSRARDEGAASVAEILAEGVIGQAFDFGRMDEDKPIEDRRRDPHATAAGDAADHADARLRKAVLGKDLGYLVTPPHCGLEIGDVVAYADTLVNQNQLKARVRSIQTRFRRTGPGPALYEQRVGLGGL